MLPVRDTLTPSGVAVATWSLIVLNGLVFAYELTLTSDQLQVLFYLLGFVPARYTNPLWSDHVGLDPTPWPLVTSMFLHGDWVHLLANMWTLRIFGDDVEDELGPSRFLLFYLVCGLVATLVHGLANAGSTVPTVGASGAISGVLAAYLFRFPSARLVVVIPIVVIPLLFEVPALAYLLFWFATQLLGGVVGDLGGGDAGGIAWWAHLGGFAAGALLHRFFDGPVAPIADRIQARSQ